MKLCRYCNKYYPESEFGVAIITEKKIYRRRKCKSCYRATKQKLKDKYRQWLINYKRNHKCSICGITDYRVLEFHHLNKKDKEFSIGTIFCNHCGFKRLRKEMKKCFIVCANCHRILHYEERNNNIK